MKKRSTLHTRRKVLALGSASALAAAWPITAARSQAAAEAALADAAKKEGRVTVYSSADLTTTERVLRQFTDKYGVAVEFQRLTAAALSQRFSTEYDAGTHLADLLISNDSVFPRQALAKGWLLKTEDLPAMAAWPKTALQSGLVPINVNPYVLAWNNEMVRGKLTSFESLNDVRMRGRVAVGDPRVLSSARLWYLALIQKFGEAFVQELGTHAAFSSSVVQAMQHLGAGAIGIYAPAILLSVNEAIERGAPVSFAACDPVVISQTLAAVPAKAPRPAAARLLLNYLMTVEGQETFNRRSYTLLPNVPGTGVLPSYVDLEPDAGDREYDRIVKLLGM